MIILKPFTESDAFSFQGAEPFADGSLPRIYYFSEEEMEAFFDLMGDRPDSSDFVYILHHADGMVLGWTVDGQPAEASWPAGDISERVEYLLESLDPHTLPLWAMSAASIQK